MRTLIVVALICAVVGLFGSLATHMLAMSGRHNAALYQVTGPIITICHGLPPILLSIALLTQRESQG
jgi:hypothetical protein